MLFGFLRPEISRILVYSPNYEIKAKKSGLSLPWHFAVKFFVPKNYKNSEIPPDSPLEIECKIL